jgi:hypothetical protein
MATIINDPYSKGRGGEAGEQIKNQIAGSLQSLAQHKMRQISQRNQAQSYQGLGMPKDLATSLSTLPEEQQKLILKQFGEDRGFGGQQGQTQAGMMEMGGGQQMGMQQGMQGNQQNMMGQQQGNQMPQPWQILQNKPQTKQQRQMYHEARQQQNITNKELQPALEASRKASSAAEKDAPTFDNLRKLIGSGQMTPAWEVRMRKAVDDSAKWVGGLAGGILGAGAGLQGAAVGTSIGTGIAGLIPKFSGTKADQAYKKGVYGFFRNAKDYFGNNIPVAEAQIFLDTLPTLEMDDEAKIAILNQMEAAGRLAKAEHRAQQDILKEHGGHAPSNLLELAHERIKPQYDQVASDIRATMDKLLEEENGQGYLERPKTWLPKF